MLLSISTT